MTTRERILRAALECFLEDGYERTTVARIRGRSGASNGALFHHFATKEAIADALYLEAIESFQAGLWELVRARPRSLRAAVRAAIAHHLGWIEQQPELARFVYLRGHLEWESQGGALLAERNRELADAIREWLGAFVHAGDVRPMPMILLTAIVSGPAHAIARRWLSGQLQRPLTDFIDPLADAAWAGLRGRSAPARPAEPMAPAIGLVRVEVLSGDGELLAAGELTNE